MVHTQALSAAQILAWADTYHARTGRWPARNSGPVPEAPGQTWATVNQALAAGARGLPGGDTLARLLARHGRGVREALSGLRAWTLWEDELVRSLPPEEAARRIGRNLLEVHVRRYELGLPDRVTG